MEKLKDNELLDIWTNLNFKQNDSENDYLTQYLINTMQIDIKNGIVISSRQMAEPNMYISMVSKVFPLEQIHLYSLVIFDHSPILPNEKSRIRQYCNINNSVCDIAMTIMNDKINKLVNVLNIAIDKKFEMLTNNNFNTIRHNVGREMKDLLVLPKQKHVIPSLSDILNQMNNYNISNSTNQTFGLTNAVSFTNNLVSTQANVVSTQANVVSAKANVVSTQANVDSTQANAVSTEANAVSTQANVVSTQANAVSTQRNAVSTQRNAVSTQRNAVSTQENVVSTQRNAVSTQENAVSTQAITDLATSELPTILSSTSTVNTPTIMNTDIKHHEPESKIVHNYSEHIDNNDINNIIYSLTTDMQDSNKNIINL